MERMEPQSSKCHCCDDKLLVEAVRHASILAKQRGLSRILMPAECIKRFCRATKTSTNRVLVRDNMGADTIINLGLAPWTPEACDFFIHVVNNGVKYPSLNFDLKFAERYPWWLSEVVMTDVPMLDAARRRAKGKKTPRA